MSAMYHMQPQIYYRNYGIQPCISYKLESQHANESHDNILRMKSNNGIIQIFPQEGMMENCHQHGPSSYGTCL